MKRLALTAMWLVACGRGVDANTSKAPAADGSAVAAPKGQTSDAGSQTSGAPCPATGLWAECGVFDRLDRAGLAPRRDTSEVSEPPLTITGSRLQVGTADMELYFYPDWRAREREQRLLNRAKYVSFDAPTLQSQPTLIFNANLIAILHGRNDHLRERVSDAITAGPPQPPTPSNP
jgi:hypothetical protein